MPYILSLQRVKRLCLRASHYLPYAFMLFALYLMQRQLAGLEFDRLLQTIKLWQISRLEIALGLTLFSFLVLSGYDALGIRHSERRLPYRAILTTSFAAFAVSNIVGHAIFTGSSVRAKTYRAGGLTLMHIAQIALLNSLTFWLGYALLLGLTLALAPLPRNLPFLSSFAAPWLGAGLLLFCFGYVWICWKWAGQDLRLKRLVVKVPRLDTAGLQFLLGCLDITVAALILYTLLPPSIDLDFVPFFILYLLAQALGVLSQVPGGLGVLDGLLLSFLSGYADPHQLVVAIILFRIIYYFLPLLVTLCAKLLAGVGRLRAL